jgi:tetratricopeptide (TPR) repeat protein
VNPFKSLPIRLPRIRFTVRRMMAAVAVTALILGGSVEAVRLKRQRDKFLTKAAEHARGKEVALETERLCVERAQSFKSSWERIAPHLNGRGLGVATDQRVAAIAEMETSRAVVLDKDVAKWRWEWWARQAAMYHASAAYHTALNQKYREAASRPWLSIELDPLPPEPEDQGHYWTERGDHGRARAAYEQAIGQGSGDVSVLNDLARLLATCTDAKVREGNRAVELATRACGMTGRTHTACLDTLAAAYAEVGDFARAVQTQTEAIGKFSPGDPELTGFRIRLRLYQAGKPYREQPGRTHH